jgi:hypothetical protein
MIDTYTEYIRLGESTNEGAKMSQPVITREECEECNSVKEFTLSALRTQDLIVTIKGRVVSYEGTWVCRCGYENSTLGEVESWN